MIARMKTTENKKQRRRTREEVEELLAAYESGTQTQRSFCAGRGLSLGTFALWRRKYRRKASAAFAEVSLPAAGSLDGFAVRLTDGTEIFLPGGMEPACLAAYVKELGRPSC